MSQYVNSSEAAMQPGRFAPSVQYSAIEPRKGMMARQDKPHDNFENETVNAIADGLGTLANLGTAYAGMSAATKARQKQEADDAEEAEKQALQNNLAQEIRKVSASMHQGKLTPTAADAKIRSLGNDYIPFIGEEAVASITSRHNGSVVELEKTVQSNKIANTELFCDEFRKRKGFERMSNEQILTFHNTQELARKNGQDLMRAYKATNVPAQKEAIMRQIKGSQSASILWDLETGMRKRIDEEGEKINNLSTVEDFINAKILDLRAKGYDNGVATYIVTETVRNSPLYQAYKGDLEVKELTNKEKSTYIDGINKDQEIVRGLTKQQLYAIPGYVSLELTLGEKGMQEFLTTRYHDGSNNGMYRQTVDNIIRTIASGTIDENARGVIQGSLPTFVNGLSNAGDRQMVNGVAGNNYIRNTVESVNDYLNISNIQSEEDITNADNILSVVFKNTNRKQIEEDMKSPDTRVREAAVEADKAVKDADALSVRNNLMSPLKNAKANGIQRLTMSSAKDRLRYSPETGKVYLKDPEGFYQTTANFFNNTLNDEYADNVADFNKSLDSMTQGDLELRKRVLASFGIAEGKYNEDVDERGIIEKTGDWFSDLDTKNKIAREENRRKSDESWKNVVESINKFLTGTIEGNAVDTDKIKKTVNALKEAVKEAYNAPAPELGISEKVAEARESWQKSVDKVKEILSPENLNKLNEQFYEMLKESNNYNNSSEPDIRKIKKFDVDKIKMDTSVDSLYDFKEIIKKAVDEGISEEEVPQALESIKYLIKTLDARGDALSKKDKEAVKKAKELLASL